MSSATSLARCQGLKGNWEQYEVGGRLYGTGNYSSLIDRLKNQYKESGCGTDPLLEKCFEKEQYIINLQNAISSATQRNDPNYLSGLTATLNEENKKFSELGCAGKINQFKIGKVQDKTKETNLFDQERIEADSKFEVKKRIFIGGSVILIALGMLLLYKSE
jgi:hypothetical protein